MQACSRAIAARAFQQHVRLRRRAAAVADLLHFPLSSNSDTRRFSIGLTRREERPQDASLRTQIEAEDPFRAYQLASRIPFPTAKDKIEDWGGGLDRALPVRLRSLAATESTEVEQYTGRDLALYLGAASLYNKRGFNLLAHLGLVEERWEAVLWICRRLLEQGSQHERTLSTPSSALRLKWRMSQPFSKLTGAPLKANSAVLQLDAQTLDVFADFSPRVPDLGWTHHKGAIGLIWRALGTMLLADAAREGPASESPSPRVLEMIAVLHQYGVVPDAVYQAPSISGGLVLQQPPTLHLLSTQILTAISDAAWRAQESSNTIRSKATGAQYDFLGNEMPGTEYRSRVPQLRPEVWLELVLWSCLHGGWIEVGASILEDVALQNNRWTLINWSDELAGSEASAPKGLDAPNFWGRTLEMQKRNVERTLSSEVVVAYVDALLNIIRLGIGERGVAASQVLATIKILKTLLDRHQFGLGTMSWNAIIVRILESEGVNIDANPSLGSEVLELVAPFAQELHLLNMPALGHRSSSDVAYTFEPSSVPLGVLHRVIYAHVQNGDVQGALKAFEQLQDFTDLNKKLSMEAFFAQLRQKTEAASGDSPESRDTLSWIGDDHRFTSNVSRLAVSYPNFHKQIPPRILASFLDLLTESDTTDFGRWLLFSRDADGPVIPPVAYRDPHLAPSLVRFATATRDGSLLRLVMRGYRAVKRNLDDKLLKAFLETQIYRQLWDSVDRILTQQKAKPSEFSWDSDTFAAVACGIIQHERERAPNPEPKRISGRDILRNLALEVYGPPFGGWSEHGEVIHSILGYLSSLDEEWFIFCVELRRRYKPQPVAFPASLFSQLVSATAQSYGSIVALRTWLLWCQLTQPRTSVRKTPFSRKNDRGLPKSDRQRPQSARGHRNKDSTLVIPSPDDKYSSYFFYDRIKPDLNNVRPIVRRAVVERGRMDDEQSQRTTQDYLFLAQWAATTLRRLGLGREEIDRELPPLKVRYHP